MSAKPDPIVKEETAREAVAAICEGAASDARAVGKIPDVAAIETFAQGVVARQIAVHEETCAKLGGIPSKPRQDPVLPDAHLEVLSDDLGAVEHTVKPLGIVDWNTATNEMQIRPGASPKLTRRERRRLRPTREDMLLKARLDILMDKPEWAMRIVAAWHRGCQVAIMRGIYTHKEIESMGADEVIKVADDSNRIFGDWKTPPRVPQKIIVAAR